MDDQLKQRVRTIIKELQDRIIKIEDDMYDYKNKRMLLEYNIAIHNHSTLLSYHDWLIEEIIGWE
jgi:hypothetical protein